MTAYSDNTAIPIAKDGMTIKVRPTLVVGLGGTGCRALTWFNHLVKSIFGGMPPFVKMLAMDSDVQESVKGVDTQFPNADFYNLFEGLRLGDILKDCFENPGYHGHLRWMQGFDLPSAVTERGCQGISRLGRVVFFETCERVIYPAVFERFGALNSLRLRQEVQELPPTGQYELSGSPVCHVISSVCGGTGSGMLLDMAYNLQAWSERLMGHEAEIFGHLVLPEAFHIESQQIMDKLQAVAYSLLQQIELLMEHRREDIPIEYAGGVHSRFSRMNQPFDAVYLLGHNRGQGADKRDQLVEMIARMIRAIVLEPATEPIQSSLNNMQLDILSKQDRATQRLMCFSSYGLRCGTTDRAVRHLETDEIGEDGSTLQEIWLSQLATKIAARRARVTGPLEEQVRSDCIAFNKDALDGARTLADTFGYQQTPGIRPNEILKDLEKQVREFRTVVQPNDDAQLIKEMEERTWQSFKSTLSQTSCQVHYVRYCLSVLRQLEKAWKEMAPRQYDAEWEETIVRAIRGLPTVKAHKGPAPLTRQDLATIADEINERIKENFTKLRRAHGQPHVIKSLGSLRKSLNEWLTSIQKLADTAKQLLTILPEPHQVLTAEQSSYSTLLFTILSPEEMLELTRRKSGKNEADERFQDPSDTLWEIVRDVALKFEADADGSDRIEVLKKELRSRDVKKKLRDWMKNYWDLLAQYYLPLPKAERISEHPCFKRAREIWDDSQPKIAVNGDGQHHPFPMKLIVSQHPDDSCIPALLPEGNFREAYVHRALSRSLDIEFQLLHFHFGFCLPSLDRLGDYEKALNRYLGPSDFRAEDFWLDPKWLDVYQKFLRHLEQDESSKSVVQAANKELVRESLQHWGLVLGKFFNRLEQDCELHFKGLRDDAACTIAMECYGQISKVHYHCQREIRQALQTLEERFVGLGESLDPVMDEIEDHLYDNYLKPLHPIFASQVAEQFDELKDQYGRLLFDYDAKAA